MEKIGILGGTFNPIHMGHLRMALEVHEQCNLAQIHIVPAYKPVHKKSTNIANFQTRVDLIHMAIEEYNLRNYFKISIHESTLKSPSYTYNSLEKWKENNDTKPYFIVGLEDFMRIDSWYKAEQLPKLTHFIVVKRANHTIQDYQATIENLWKDKAIQQDAHSYSIEGSTIEYIETSRLDISSSMIRKAICTNKNTHCILPQWVEAYIRRNKNILDVWSEEFKD